MDWTKLRNELARDEGRRLLAYEDTNGFWTIGVGHLLGSECRMTKITDDECDALLNADITEAEELVKSCVPLYFLLDDVRQRALVNMAFNRGHHMCTSTTITPAIVRAARGGTTQTEDWSAVAAAILKSPWAAQIGDRAKRLAYMLETGKTV
jgi:lysozyme